MGNYLIDSDCDNIQDMVLKTIKNRNIACLGLGYKLILKSATTSRAGGMRMPLERGRSHLCWCPLISSLRSQLA
jgi:hypothetical protein